MAECVSMTDLIGRIIEDDSDRRRGIIRFTVRCEACGKLWRGDPVRFTMAGIAAENANKQIVYDAMWTREWENARQAAIDSAREHFNLCPICKKASCEQCFYICDNIDMCEVCARRLGERGEPVFRAL